MALLFMESKDPFPSSEEYTLVPLLVKKDQIDIPAQTFFEGIFNIIL
jgi:hypothetical protein